VLRYLATGDGLMLATASIVAKTLLLYAIMVTGSIWERDVFGRYLFAPAFFWEDVVSMLVLALHTTYLISLFSGAVDPQRQMWLALAAYASYVVNATQFLLKLRAARRQEHAWMGRGLVGHTS
jgi:3-vinyl bacteriochlorophyllide hydratase